MSIQRHTVDEIRARTDIVAVIGATVTLRRRGSSYVGLCPFHNEKSPSFNVVPSRQIYHCFGCGAGGDVFGFLQKTRGVSFVEAVKELAAQCGVLIEERPLSPAEKAVVSRRNDLYGAAEQACKYFENTLIVGRDGQAGRDYLKARGVTLDTARKYRLGFVPEGWNHLENHLRAEGFDGETLFKAGLVKKNERTNSTYDVFRARLIFPILDDRGRPVAFGGRVLPGADKEAPKYLNSPGTEIYEKSKVLYGLSFARNAVQRRDRLIVVEGYFDAVSLWQAGFEEAVAPCGTALTTEQLEAVRRLTTKVIALFDTDEAGIKAAMRALDLFLAAGVEAKRLDLPGAKDPDEFIQKFGASAFEERLEKTESLLELVIRRTIDREGSSSEGRGRTVEALAPTLRKLEGAARSSTITRLAGWTGIPEAQVEQLVGRPPRPVEVVESRPAWSPGGELGHLLWLVVHFPAQMRGVLDQVDPDLVTDRATARVAMGRLVEGEPLGEVLTWAQEEDPDLARILSRAAAKSDLYRLESVVHAARGILARMQLRQIDARILAINREIHRCETTGDKSSYQSLARELAGLYAQQAALKQTSARRAGPDDSRP